MQKQYEINNNSTNKGHTAYKTKKRQVFGKKTVSGIVEAMNLITIKIFKNKFYLKKLFATPTNANATH